MKTKTDYGTAFKSTVDTKLSNLSAFEMGENAVAVRAATVKNPYNEALDPYNFDQWKDGYAYGVLCRMRAAIGKTSKMRFASTSNDVLSLDMKIASLAARKSANR